MEGCGTISGQRRVCRSRHASERVGGSCVCCAAMLMGTPPRPGTPDRMIASELWPRRPVNSDQPVCARGVACASRRIHHIFRFRFTITSSSQFHISQRQRSTCCKRESCTVYSRVQLYNRQHVTRYLQCAGTVFGICSFLVDDRPSAHVHVMCRLQLHASCKVPQPDIGHEDKTAPQVPVSGVPREDRGVQTAKAQFRSCARCGFLRSP